MKIGLRICINTLQGALEGVPNLLRLFDEYQVQASFFFAMGPDRSGQLIGRRALQPWQSHLKFSSRFYGTLLLPPHISRRASEVMRSTAAAGHETGLLGYDRAAWVSKAAFADETWTQQQMTLAVEAYESVFAKRPQAFAAPGWQLNPHLLGLEQKLGFDYTSDVRGKTAFYPVLQGVESNCPQLPTTLPTLSDLMLRGGGVTAENAHEYLYSESQYILPNGHVYSLDAEMEGIRYLSLIEKLIVMWKGYDEGLTTLGKLSVKLDRTSLGRHQVGWSDEETKVFHVATQALQV